jgi:hypothetical protein
MLFCPLIKSAAYSASEADATTDEMILLTISTAPLAFAVDVFLQLWIWH